MLERAITFRKLVREFALTAALLALWRPAWAQMQMPMPMSMPMPMVMPGPLGIGDNRLGSGTSWLPDVSVTRAESGMRGVWMLMLHGDAFLQAIKITGDRGTNDVGSINWLMAMASRPMAGGTLAFRAMTSLEPLTVGRCGYPDLFQTGETCRGEVLHDEQHPHDLFMELSADYRRAVSSRLAIELYGGPSGEPALGPTAFPHRASAEGNPFAPIAHHWLDSTHISFGVVTAGLYGERWKIEGSAFNGREPDDKRYGFDLAPLDSYSGRVWLVPTSAWAIQISAGRLNDVDREAGEGGVDETRVTASASHERIRSSGSWATTVAWGVNVERGQATHAVLAETSAAVTTATRLFGRAEVVQKTPADLALPPVSSAPEHFTLAKLSAGLVRRVMDRSHVQMSIGGTAGAGLAPDALRATYGSRSSLELSVFVQVSPGASE